MRISERERETDRQPETESAKRLKKRERERTRAKCSLTFFKYNTSVLRIIFADHANDEDGDTLLSFTRNTQPPIRIILVFPLV